MKYRVKANPKAGTCFQVVEANSEDEAIEKAWDNPNGWEHAKPRDRKDWFLNARNIG